MSAAAQSSWVAFGPTAPAYAHPAPAYTHPAVAPQQHYYYPQQQYQQHQQPSYYQPQQYQQYQQQQWGQAPMAPPATGALVLYNPSGMLQSFEQQQKPSNKPNVNPYTPGLAPLPVVPSPKTFVAEDAVSAKFPNSSKNARDTLSWITHEIFSDVKASVSSESAAQRTPLKELRQVSA